MVTSFFGRCTARTKSNMRCKNNAIIGASGDSRCGPHGVSEGYLRRLRSTVLGSSGRVMRLRAEGRNVVEGAIGTGVNSNMVSLYEVVKEFVPTPAVSAAPAPAAPAPKTPDAGCAECRRLGAEWQSRTGYVHPDMVTAEQKAWAALEAHRATHREVA